MKTLESPLQRFSRALPLAVCVMTAGHATERWATLEAIHKIENPANLTRPGSRGELGAYQFRASTWRMHTSLPFSEALNRTKSDLVAVQHYTWIQRGLERARIPVTPYNIALAWNSGLAATVSGKAPRVAHGYAQRASNLADVYRRNAAARDVVKTLSPPLIAEPVPAPPAHRTAVPRFEVSVDDPPLTVYVGGPRFVVSVR